MGEIRVLKRRTLWRVREFGPEALWGTVAWVFALFELLVGAPLLVAIAVGKAPPDALVFVVAAPALLAICIGLPAALVRMTAWRLKDHRLVSMRTRAEIEPADAATEARVNAVFARRRP